MNKQKDRLVELLKETRCERSCDGFKNIEVCNGCIAYERYAESADRILADGWMRPPVKVGQSFWHIEEYTHELLPDEYPTVKVVCESKVEKIFIKKYGNSFGDTRKSFSFHDIGKTVFLTKEEAEAKLKEGVLE